MNIIESIITAYQEIILHKLRSFLTILGIIFGVGSVIAMMSIGAGAEKEAVKQIEAMGAKNITVKAKNISGDVYKKAKRNLSKGLHFSDIEYLKESVSTIELIASQKKIDAIITYKNIKPSANVIAVDPNFFEVLNRRAYLGREINNEDLSDFRKVCVLGYSISKSIFHNENPTGKIIKIGGERFVIIGIMPDVSMKSKSVTGNQGINISSRNLNNDVYIPISLGNKIFSNYVSVFSKSSDDPNYNSISEIIIRVNSMDNLKKNKELIEKILKRRHKNVEDFEIIIPLEKLEQKKNTQKIFNIVMTGIAALSLLVGGIGIMNIMLASVSERTKEIGIRRAIGASKKEIMIQFIIEALVLSIIGGVLGILTGALISKVVSYKAGWETVITLSSVFLAFSVSALTGLFSGIFPAFRASEMDPVECLRSE